jgi:hypothetical protein
VIEGKSSGHNGGGVRIVLASAYIALGKFLEADGTKDGYDMALHYFGKITDMYKSDGNEAGAQAVQLIIDNTKSKHTGGETKTSFSDEMLKKLRLEHENSVRNRGKDAMETLQSGISLSFALYKSYKCCESERLSNEMVAISRRVHGPDHDVTRQAQTVLDTCRTRLVKIMTVCGSKAYQVLSFSDGEGKYVVKGPVSKSRTPGNEKITKVAIHDIHMLARGTPVVCHGLKNAVHLNGNIGDAIDFDFKTDRYLVHFEDKSLKPSLVKPENLRILFDLPDK